MVDFRYHLASLMAVFLALGIGMLIGNSFVGMASIESQNRALADVQRNVSEVRRQVQATHRENVVLQTRLDERDRAVRALATAVTQGLLADHRVAVVVLGPPKRPETVTELTNMIVLAGAPAPTVTRISPDWLPRDPETRNTILARLQVPPGKAGIEAANRKLAHAITSGSRTAALREAAALSPGLQLDGDYQTPVGAVILVDASQPSSEETLSIPAEDVTERPMLTEWRGMGLKVVAAEAETAPVSLIAFFRGLDVATVDNVDTSIGQLASVMALVIGSGNYGVKASADRLLPELNALPAPSSPVSPLPSRTSPP